MRLNSCKSISNHSSLTIGYSFVPWFCRWTSELLGQSVCLERPERLRDRSFLVWFPDHSISTAHQTALTIVPLVFKWTDKRVSIVFNPRDLYSCMGIQYLMEVHLGMSGWNYFELTVCNFPNPCLITNGTWWLSKLSTVFVWTLWKFPSLSFKVSLTMQETNKHIYWCHYPSISFSYFAFSFNATKK